MNNIHQQLRVIREKEGYSQERLAGEIGLSKNYISQIERGIKTPSIEALTNILAILGYDMVFEKR